MKRNIELSYSGDEICDVSELLLLHCAIEEMFILILPFLFFFNHTFERAFGIC